VGNSSAQADTRPDIGAESSSLAMQAPEGWREPDEPKHASLFFGRDQGLVFFLAFLILITIVVPMTTLPQLGRLAVDLIFAITLILGAFATINHRAGAYFVVGLTTLALAVNVVAELVPSRVLVALAILLKLACVAILVFMTLKRTLRAGPVTKYRVIGGIAGYVLIGLAWTLAYQLVVYQDPTSIYVEGARITDGSWQQPNELLYFSFITLTTVGYGDMHPVNGVIRSLAAAEALVGQLYVAILIASLVGMALQDQSRSSGSS
jgi:hypothetical protein